MSIYEWLLAAMSAAYGGAFASSLAGRWGWAKACGAAGVVAGAFSVGLFLFTQQRPPLLGFLEITTEVGFLLGIFALAGWGRTDAGRYAARWSWGFCLTLGVLFCCSSRKLTPDSFMFDYPPLILFFQMRLTAIALLLYGAACHGDLLLANGDRRLSATIRRSRPWLLAGVCAFLISEFFGAVWSFQWTGWFWQWNRGFLESAALFMVLALPLHLPARWSRSRRLVCLTGMLPGAVITAVTLLHQVG